MLTAVSGLQHISKLLGDRDIPSLQRWLKRVGESLPVITTERPEMNSHQERPGKGVMYQVDQKESPKHPDFKGFVVLEMDYKAGEKVKLAAWLKPTSRGNNLISLSEDNYTKKMKEQEREDKEVEPAYVRHRRADDDLPF